MPPAFEYGRTPGLLAAVIGGVVYRGAESPAFQGRYFFADSFVAGLWALREHVPPYTAEFLPLDELVFPVAIGEDRGGELYVADLFADRVYRLRLPAGPATPDAACIVEANRASARLAAATARDLRACALAGARGRLGGESIDACAESDRHGLVARRVERLAQAHDRFCQGPQPFGSSGFSAAATAAASSAHELARDVFGPDLDAAFADAEQARATHLCQRKLQRALDVCQHARRTEWLRCKQAGLRNGEIRSLEQLARCLGEDPNGRIERACGEAGGRLAEAIARSCEGVDLAAALPGCASEGSEAAAACLQRAGRCRHCRLFDATDALGVNCDRYDDAAVNASCGPLD